MHEKGARHSTHIAETYCPIRAPARKLSPYQFAVQPLTRKRPTVDALNVIPARRGRGQGEPAPHPVPPRATSAELNRLWVELARAVQRTEERLSEIGDGAVNRMG